MKRTHTTGGKVEGNRYILIQKKPKIWMTAFEKAVKQGMGGHDKGMERVQSLNFRLEAMGTNTRSHLWEMNTVVWRKGGGVGQQGLGR